MKWGTASKFLLFPGNEPRATDHPPLFLHKITSLLPDSTGFEAWSLLGCYLRVQLVKLLPIFQTWIFIDFTARTSNVADTECWLHSHFNGLYYYSQLIELWLNKSPNQVTKQDAVPAYGRRQQDVTFTYVRLVIIRWRCHVRRYWVVGFDRSWYAKVLILVLITF
jgi:hypothetical protein